MATILKASGEELEVQPENGTDFSLKECQTIVGGHLEMVPLADGRVMILNEEGKLDDLPVNLAATALYLEERAGYDEIVGDVLVCTNDEFR